MSPKSNLIPHFGPENRVFSVAKHAVLDPLLDFLKRDVVVREIKGCLEKVSSQKDLQSVRLNNLWFDVTEFQLRKLLEEVEDKVRGISIPIDKSTGRARGFAFLEFHDRDSAKIASLKLNNKDAGGRTIRASLVVLVDPAPQSIGDDHVG